MSYLLTLFPISECRNLVRQQQAFDFTLIEAVRTGGVDHPCASLCMRDKVTNKLIKVSKGAAESGERREKGKGERVGKRRESWSKDVDVFGDL